MEEDSPVTVAAPERVMLPLTSGLTAEGLTRRPANARVELFPMAVLTVNVTCEAVRLVKLTAPAPVTVAQGTFPPVSQANPLGQFRIMVPRPIVASLPQTIDGPVRAVVDGDVPPGAESAEMAEPPEAGVIVVAFLGAP